MLLTEDKAIDIFVSSKIGSFKHIKYHKDSTKNNKKCIENLVEIKSLQKDDTITSMVWGNAEQTEILIAKKNQQIQVYNTLDGFTKDYIADFGTGNVVGLGRYNLRLIAGVSEGLVKVWSKKDSLVINTGGKIDRMRSCVEDNTLLATGGEENDLKVWKIGNSTPVFVAKNLPHDWLQLRRPVWVSDLTFLSDNLLAVCSRHGYVRLYDTRAQRRPVINVDFQMAATCITPGFDERTAFVGFGRGQLHLVDLRKGRPDKGYKGAAGAITDIAVSKRDRLLISASLDRHLRVHASDTKELLYKQYLTSKLSAVLVQTESVTPMKNAHAEIKEESELKEEKEENRDDLDEIFDQMDTIGGSRKRSAPVDAEADCSKPSTVGSTDAELEDDKDDAIVKLLRSTERQKRRREQRKREKKAKSIYHNA